MNCDNEFVNQNMGLVMNIAKRFTGRGTEFEDLVQIGCIGLIKAASKFNEELGYKFSTYAVPLIMGEIKRYLRDNNYIKISRKLKEDLTKVNACRQNFIKEKGREPVLSELISETKLTREEIVDAIDSEINLSSFDNGLDCVLSDEGSEENVLDKIYVKELMEKLDERSRTILQLRYFKNKTQQEVSDIIGVSQVQISRLEKKILTLLKSMSK